MWKSQGNENRFFEQTTFRKNVQEEIKMDRDEIVCNCMGVTAGEIQDAIEAGARTVEEIQEATGAGTVCGGCVGEIQQMLEE